MKIKKYFSGIIGLLFLFAIFAAIVSSSGCVRSKDCPVVVSQTDGIVVTSLRPSYNLIPVGDEVILTAEVQNKGTAPAKNVKSYIWSKPGFAILDADPVKDGKGDNFNPNLAPPRLDICSAGDSNALQWNLQAGCDPRESVIAIAVEYDYTSDGWASVFMVSGDEAAKTGGKFNEKGENHPSAGPIQVLLEPLQNEPVIVSDTSKSFDVKAKFKNLGSGVAGDAGEGALRKVTITTIGPCEFSQSNDGIQKDGSIILQGDLAVSLSIGSSSIVGGNQEAFKILKMKYNGGFPFSKDFCRINVHADYHYRDIEAVNEKMGITGTSSQVADCRANATSSGP